MAYQPKPGQGTLYKNKQKNQNEKAPVYKGFHILPDGSVLGLAMWKIELEGGTILSLKTDDGEAKYWAKKHGRRAHLAEGADDGGQQQERSVPQPRTATDRGGDRQSRHGGGSSRHAETRQFSEDLDDEIPFE